MFTGRLSDKVKYKTIVKHKEKNHEQIIVDGEVYIEHRFLKKTIKIEDGKLTILPPDAPIEAGAEVQSFLHIMSVQELILEMTGLWRMPNGVQAKWMFLCQFI